MGHINSDKTEFINFENTNDNDTEANFTITDTKGNLIKQKDTMKILGIRINRNNNMESHISSLNGKICTVYNKIRGTLQYLTDKNRQIIIEAKVKSLLMPSVPLIPLL